MTERVPLLRKVKQPNGQTSELSIEQALRDTNLLGAALGNPNSWSTLADGSQSSVRSRTDRSRN